MRTRMKWATALLAAATVAVSGCGAGEGSAQERQEYLLTVMDQAQAIYDQSGAYPRSVDDVEIGKFPKPSNTWFISNGPSTALCVELTALSGDDLHVYSGAPDVVESGTCDMDVVHEQGK